jgi:PAS domain S-box-containing protein
MKNVNVAIVGAGPGCLAILDIFSREGFDELLLDIVGIADIDPDAPALAQARNQGIFTTLDYHDLFEIPHLDLIIELTNDPAVAQAIQREKPLHVRFMDHSIARFFWVILRLEDEKREALMGAEKKIRAERDRTSNILNSLTDAVMVLDENLNIESANETFLRYFSLSREETIGRKCHSVLFELKDPCRDSFCPIGKEKTDHSSFTRKEYLITRGGKGRYYETDHVPLVDPGGGPLHRIIVMRDVTQRKRLELDLQESRKKYKDLFQNAREGLALFDSEGTILENNFSLSYMLGYPLGDLRNMKLFQLAEKESRSILSDYLEDLKILGFTSVEMDFVKKNGDPLPVEANITWVPEEDLFQLMVRDISVKRKMEESRRIYSERLEKEVEERTRKLKESEEETRRQKKTAEGIIYGSPIPMMVIDKSHRIAYWNKACENLTGYRSEEMIGTDRQWEPLYPEKRPILADLIIDNKTEDIQKFYNERGFAVRKSASLEGAFEGEHFFPQLGKRGIHLYVNAAPIKDDSGEVQGAIVTYQDFTERIRMTEEIKRREAFVQNLVQNSIDGIIGTEARGMIVIFNRGAVELLGYTPEETIGKINYLDILPEETGKAVREAFYGERYGPPGRLINMEGKLLNKDNEEIPVRLSGALLHEQGREVGSVVFVQDLREILKLRHEKEQDQRMAAIGRTVAGLAHYIKNILTGLKGGEYVINSALFRKDFDLMQKGWGMVRRNVDQIGSIVTDMLIYSKDRTPQYEMVDPAELVKDVVALMEERAKLSGVTLLGELEPSLKRVAMDSSAIQSCLLNLVSNAIDACTLEGIMHGKGTVKIRTDKPPGWGVRFQVADNGTGMGEDTQKKLFTDFFSTKGYKGTGLGLPVTQKIVKEHGGELHFQSEEGRGTTFTLLLPDRKALEAHLPEKQMGQGGAQE